MLERRRTSPSTAFGKWSVLSNNEPEKFGTMIPDYHNTLVTIAMLSCNRLPFLKLALAQIEKNRREGNPADFGVATEVVIVDDSPAGSHTDRKIVKELSTRYPRFQLMYEHEVPKWSYTNRSVRLMDGSTLPHVAAFHENVAKTHSAQMPLVVRLLKLKTRKSIGEKRTLVQRYGSNPRGGQCCCCSLTCVASTRTTPGCAHGAWAHHPALGRRRPLSPGSHLQENAAPSPWRL